MLFRLSRESYAPSSAMKVVDKGSNAVAYIYDTNGKFGVRYGAVMFTAKAQKPTYNYTYRSAEQRDAAVTKFFEGCQQHLAYVAKNRAERNKPHSLQVGDILSASWGYEQTNIDFYQVTAVTAKTVKIRELMQARSETGWCQGTCVPVKDKFKGDETSHRSNNTNSVRVRSYASASKWDGKPENWTAYH